jgi:hypothetical protein
MAYGLKSLAVLAINLEHMWPHADEWKMKGELDLVYWLEG